LRDRHAGRHKNRDTESHTERSTERNKHILTDTHTVIALRMCVSCLVMSDSL